MEKHWNKEQGVTGRAHLEQYGPARFTGPPPKAVQGPCGKRSVPRANVHPAPDSSDRVVRTKLSTGRQPRA
jgi:hypothetical protein